MRRSLYPWRPWAIALLVLWTGFGVYRSVEGLRVFWGPYSENVVWGYSGPRPAWTSKDSRPPQSNHYTGTLGERYWRATELGELDYCAGYSPRTGR